MKYLLKVDHYIGTTYYKAGTVVDLPENWKFARGAAVPAEAPPVQEKPKKKADK